MINLLPNETKQQLLFARRNSVLKNWVLATIIGLLGVLIVIAAGQLFISRSTAVWQKQVNDTKQQLEQQQLQQTQNRVTEMSDSIKLASQVLSKQVLFSKLLSQITTVLPTGTSLQSLSIKSAEGGIDLTAIAKDYQSATQVQINLADPKNKVFEKADIVSVTCQDTGKTEYPCTVTVRALFAKDNAFQYSTNQTGVVKP
jgi:Tfp pilus assembly protein PilN